MIRCLVWIWMAACAVQATALFEPSIVHTSLRRILDISHPTALREVLHLTLSTSQDVSQYTLVLTSPHCGNTTQLNPSWPDTSQLQATGSSWDPIVSLPEPILAFVDVQREEGASLKFQLIQAKGTCSLQGVHCYQVTLDQPLTAKESLKLKVRATWTHVSVPVPWQTTLTTAPQLTLTASATWHTGYTVLKQRTTVQLPSQTRLLSHTNEHEPVRTTASEVIYGIYENTQPWQLKPIRIHYMASQVPLTLVTMRQEASVSLWAHHFAFEDHCHLRHDGPRIKGEFNRAELRQAPSSGVVQRLNVQLPAGSSMVYFRDEVGNVSTSSMRKVLHGKVPLELRPRFPLVGGWRFVWHHGYTVPLSRYLSWKSDSRQQLTLPFVRLFENVTADSYSLTVILPEGASQVEWKLPFEVDKVTRGRHFTFLDSVGRETVTFEKRFIVEEHAQPIQIFYDISYASLLQKPFAVALVLFIVFAIAMIYVRVDFSLEPDHARLHREAVDDLVSRLRLLVVRRHAIFKQIQSSQENNRRNHLKSLDDLQLLLDDLVQRARSLNHAQMPSHLRLDAVSILKSLEKLVENEQARRSLVETNPNKEQLEKLDRLESAIDKQLDALTDDS